MRRIKNQYTIKIIRKSKFHLEIFTKQRYKRGCYHLCILRGIEQVISFFYLAQEIRGGNMEHRQVLYDTNCIGYSKCYVNSSHIILTKNKPSFLRYRHGPISRICVFEALDGRIRTEKNGVGRVYNVFTKLHHVRVSLHITYHYIKAHQLEN